MKMYICPSFRNLALIVCILLCIQAVSAQVDSSALEKPLWVTGVGTHYGFIIPHSEELKPISETQPYGIQAEGAVVLRSERAWNNCNCFGKLGLSFNYFNYQNPEVLGNSYNLMIFGEPYLGLRSRLFATFRGGMGVTYLNQVYDEVENPANLFYSSPVSFILALNIGLNYAVTDQWVIQLAANYNHISNGGASQPNKGMNFPTLSAGVSYYLQPLQFPDYGKRTDFKSDPWDYYARLFGTMRVVDADSVYGETRTPMLGVEGGVIRNLTSINAVIAGAEFSYDGSFNEQIERRGSAADPFVLSLTVGHAFIFGKFSFTQQFAWYAHRSFPSVENDFFQRYAIYYQIGKYLNAGFSLKAHGHVAENMDLRIGILL